MLNFMVSLAIAQKEKSVCDIESLKLRFWLIFLRLVCLIILPFPHVGPRWSASYLRFFFDFPPVVEVISDFDMVCVKLPM